MAAALPHARLNMRTTPMRVASAAEPWRNPRMGFCIFPSVRRSMSHQVIDQQFQAEERCYGYADQLSWP